MHILIFMSFYGSNPVVYRHVHKYFILFIFNDAYVCKDFLSSNKISIYLSHVLRVKESEYHKKETLTLFCNFNCKRRFQTNSCDVYIILVMYICNVNSKYLHGY